MFLLLLAKGQPKGQPKGRAKGRLERAYYWVSVAISASYSLVSTFSYGNDLGGYLCHARLRIGPCFNGNTVYVEAMNLTPYLAWHYSSLPTPLTAVVWRPAHRACLSQRLSVPRLLQSFHPLL